MAQIVPKLNLNKTPALFENNSLVFAKNIRADVDGSIHKDYSITNIFKDKNLLEQLRIDFNKKDDAVYKHYYDIIKEVKDDDIDENYKIKTDKDYEIIDIISYNTGFYILLYIIKTETKIKKETEDETEANNENKDETETETKQSIIVRYNEEDGKLYPCNCNWNYSDGNITGLVVNNLLNEKLLVIAESSETDKIPLKCINLGKSKYTDDETIYTQTPNIPFINLLYHHDYNFSIPNGVYQFFIRYKIRENYYTSWFPASKELFAGNINTINTIYGTIKYHKDVINSDNSFILGVDISFEEYTKNFENYQIGFIVSNKKTSKARAWKHFSFDTKIIYFDYKSEDAEEINIEDFTNSVYGIYNVKNIEMYNNKLYISNYEEFNFNETFDNKINVDVIQDESINKTLYYDKYPCTTKDNTVTNINYCDNETITTILSRLLLNSINYNIKHPLFENKTYSVVGNLNVCGRNINTHITVNATHINHNSAYKYNRFYIYKNNDSNNNDEYSDINDKNIKEKLESVVSNVLYFSEEKIMLTDKYYIELIDSENYDENNDNSWTICLNFTFDYDITYVYDTDVISVNTLLPKQSYNIYIHYVKQTGETTNGSLVKTQYTQYKNNDFDKPIYLKFSNISIPKGFVCYFFSIVLIENKAITVLIKDRYKNKNYSDGYCLDLNSRLYSFNKNFKVIGFDNEVNNNNESDATYYDSNDTTYCRYFGAEGLVHIAVYNEKLDKMLIVRKYKNNDIHNLKLTKLTPYLRNTTYCDYLNENLLGYICKIYPLDDNTTKIYNDGSMLYTKNNNVENIDNLNLVEYNKYKETENNRNKNWIGTINITTTQEQYIYSNFNLNYVQLVDDLKQKIFTYYDSPETVTTEIRKNYNKMFYIISSLLLSTMYELDSTYYEYDRKYYYTYNTRDIYIFNNTLRCSIKNSDEDNLDVFKFEANDYYNIPTNKGIITNIKGLGDILLIHTKDSMFKFTGHNTLQSNNGDVQQTESDIFNTGVGEIFSSDFGYAGLYDKKDSITTMNGYVFYDKNANVIYAYSGNGQIVKLSDSIEKIFRYDTKTNVSFANDYYNNRFFVCLHYSNNKTLTLSYCFNEEVKSFISIHDFAFENAFNTRTKCYFITKDKKQISSVDKTSFGLYPKFNTLNSIYPSYVLNGSGDNIKYASIIDVIENSSYENIKTLNFISWNNAIVETEFPTYENADKPFNALESKDEKYPCRSIMLYTDTCSTDYISCIGISNNNNIDKIRYYKLPRYNQGLWTLNYFRNILNSNNNTYKYSGDNNSLIEGKYFVSRFILDGDFKFETINFNYDTKL